jgi:hypothetical protein
MSEQLVSALRQHAAMQQKQKLVAGELWHDFDLVVATEIGTPVDPSNSRRAINCFCERAGINH